MTVPVPDRRHFLRLAGPGAALALAGCAAAAPVAPPGPPPAPMAAPRPRVGERWVYTEINRYNGLVLGDLELEVASLAPLVLVQRRLRPTGRAGVIAGPDGPVEARFAEPWSVLVDPGFDEVLQFQDPVPLLPPQLVPGSRAETRTRFTVAGNSGVYGWTQQLVATRLETLATPAGRLECLVIERRIRFDSPNPFRYARERRERRWYAPAVNGWARREWTGDYRDQTFADDWMLRRLEDSVRLELKDHLSAPVSRG